MSMKPHPDGRAKKVTVSIPADLFARGEEERERRQISRSEFVAELYRRHLQAIEEERRVARYAAAYAKQPVTEEERAWAEAGAQALGALYDEE